MRMTIWLTSEVSVERIAAMNLVTFDAGIGTVDDVEPGPRVLDESFSILLLLLEGPVGIFLILCRVLAAAVLALYVGMFVAELPKARF